ncbi:MAG: BamA/TamA family outer membrane protein [Bacteroidetes bacterium]|nr:BamA/TamA family outer membrane protein [Bacteroidota bacterium]
MSAGQPFFKKTHTVAIFSLLIAFTLYSCKTPVIVKKYQPGKPFVFQTNINVIGNFTNEEKDKLASRLKSQLDDSMRSRAVSKVFWSVMKTPPVYDNANASKSIIYMRALLVSLGYFKDTITYTTKVDTTRSDQLRTTITYTVKPGKLVHIDSFRYNIKDSALQQIALDNQDKAFVKKGSAFAKSSISAELDRMVEMYRERGYLRFGREDLYGLWDTLDISLIRPTTDPFEQMELLQRIRARREDPKANLEIRLRADTDSNKLKRYYIGQITAYPDYTPDSLQHKREEEIVNGVRVISFRHLFKPKIIPQNIYLKHGDLYDQRNYFRTINRFNSLGSWRLVNIEPSVRPGKDTVDFAVKLNPAVKYSFTTNLEGSRNQSPYSGNLFGIAINIGLQNRNFARRANQANTNLRFGVETGRDTATDIKFLQTKQISISHNIYFPRAIGISRILKPKNRNNVRSILSLNGSITERRELYNLNLLNGSWGYEFQLGKWPLSVRAINIEYTSLTAKQKLLDIFNNNPSLKRVFNDGLISSIIVNAATTGGKKNNVNTFKVNGELSGFPGIIRNKFFDENLYRFIKIDGELVRKISYRKTDLVLRLFAGAGYEFNSTVNINKRFNLPFFRQYFAGGPNSMRAWALRKLGPGSVVDDFGITGQPDRYGDMQIEGNIEYRFPLANVAGVKINGAVFTDIGNIWYVKNDISLPEGSVFKFSNLAKDLAIGTGFGVRVDFNFFVVRLDFSHKVKDPSPSPDKQYLQNKWFGYAQKDFFGGSRFQLGISYPFIL